MMERIWRIITGLILIAAGVWIAWYEGPLLIRDFGIGDNVEAAAQAKLVKGSCSSRLVIYFCDLDIDQQQAGTTRKTELSYLFVDLPSSDYSVRLLSPKGDSSIVTTDIGQDMLWNRAISLAATLIFCLSVGLVIPLTKGKGRAQAA